MNKPIKVLVVEDSLVSREFLVHLLRSDAALQVIGTAKDGEEAVEFLKKQKPDVITMDINMPRMDGFETTRRIMETEPTPVVIVTATTNPRQVATTFRAMEAGAVAVLPIPAGIGHPEHHETARNLIQTVKSMSEVKVVRRWPRSRVPTASPSRPDIEVGRPAFNVDVVAIGASTGGPPVLQTILSGLPRNFPSPILIVQHIAMGFVDGFVHWLRSSSPLPIEVARHKERMIPGHVYVAPDDYQMTLASHRLIALQDAPPENGLRPSVSALFRSVAQTCGSRSVGVLLTGMGKDGATELRHIRDAGGVTIAQDERTCVVYGMPGEAVKLDAASFVLPPDRIAALLASLVKK